MINIAPSILSADFSKLGEDVKTIEAAKGDMIHIDVMDGRFVPNISFGVPIIKCIRDITDLPFDVHLMIEEPSRYIKSFVDAGADIITVHIEADRHVDRTINYIKSLGAKASVALNPATPVNQIEQIFEMLDMVLLMSVNPGFGGQKFISYTYDKIRKIKKMADELNPDIMIEVDGGVDSSNIKGIVEAGANVLVAGSSVFKGGAISKNIQLLRGEIK